MVRHHRPPILASAMVTIKYGWFMIALLKLHGHLGGISECPPVENAVQTGTHRSERLKVLLWSHRSQLEGNASREIDVPS